MKPLYPWVTSFARKLWTGLVLVLASPFKGLLWLWKWLTTKPTFKITVSYDSKFGNSDDIVYEGVPKILKQNWKELNFITADKKSVKVRANAGLNYRVEEE